MQVVEPALPVVGETQLKVAAVSSASNVTRGSKVNLTSLVSNILLSARYGLSSERGAWLDARIATFLVNDWNVVFGSVKSVKETLVAGSGPWFVRKIWKVTS